MLRRNFFCQNFFSRSLAIIGGSFISTFALMPSLRAAEYIEFVYSPLSKSLEISSLEAFATDGTITSNLKFYLDIVDASDAEKELLRTTLTRQIPVDPVLLSRVLRTYEGERLLDSFGQIVKIQGGRSAKFALRGALVGAAFEEEGLTLLNVLQNLEVNVQVDLATLLTFANSIKVIVEGTERFVNEVEQLSETEAKNFNFINYDRRLDLRQQRTDAVQQETLFLEDPSRDRQFYASIYRPQRPVGLKIPVVVISHGLASEPAAKSTLAKHLASYGFFVVMPQHPGSDRDYLESFITSFRRELADLEEFINRPLDISFTLDELERLNTAEFGGRLDLENVGIYGHSYGGYTALAVAGAAPVPNYDALEEDCAAAWGIFNNALLLQCRALQLAPQTFNFRDDRIQAVIAANPVNASIFAETALSQIQIPTAIIAGSYDPATPFIFEQVRSFPWISTPDKYLVLEEGQAHVDISKLDFGISRLLDRIPSLNLPSPELLNNYSEAIALSFFQVYAAKNRQYAVYLNPAYTKYLSEGQEFKTFMITQDSLGELEGAIADFKAQYQLE